MTMGKISVAIAVFISMLHCINSASSALLCNKDPLKVSPASCGNWSGANFSDFGNVYNCSDSYSAVTRFEVYGGCSPNVYSGSKGSLETPANIQYGSSQTAGKYCYCKIKSINGTNLPLYSRWVFYDPLVNPVDCSGNCTTSCTYYAHLDSNWRRILFSNLQN